MYQSTVLFFPHFSLVFIIYFNHISSFHQTSSCTRSHRSKIKSYLQYKDQKRKKNLNEEKDERNKRKYKKSHTHIYTHVYKNLEHRAGRISGNNFCFFMACLSLRKTLGLRGIKATKNEQTNTHI